MFKDNTYTVNEIKTYEYTYCYYNKLNSLYLNRTRWWNNRKRFHLINQKKCSFLTGCIYIHICEYIIMYYFLYTNLNILIFKFCTLHTHL